MQTAASFEAIDFTGLCEQLAAAYGPQHWWPAQHAFEVMVGAVLVQRTTWRNAARAIEALRDRALLDPVTLATVDPGELAELVRSAGFLRTKSRRVLGLAAFVRNAGGIAELGRWPTTRLRAALLDLDGVGPETADSILLYAFERPVVIIDEYLRRLVRRLRSPDVGVADDVLRESIFAEIDDAPRLNELHALIVEHGKRHCASRPRCGGCLLRQRCFVGSALRVQPQARDAAAGPAEQVEIGGDDLVRFR